MYRVSQAKTGKTAACEEAAGAKFKREGLTVFKELKGRQYGYQVVERGSRI